MLRELNSNSQCIFFNLKNFFCFETEINKLIVLSFNFLTFKVLIKLYFMNYQIKYGIIRFIEKTEKE